MNHKRRRPKHQRAGCLLCKPHKHESAKLKDREPVQARRAARGWPDDVTEFQGDDR